MKFILYLYYLIYQILDKGGFVMYKHSPFTPKAESITHDNYIKVKGDAIIFLAAGWVAAGQLLYIYCFLFILYFFRL